MLKNLNISRRILLGAGVTLLPFVGLAFYANSNIQLLLNSIGWVNHTHKVIADATKLQGAALDMETGGRGFLLAGKEQFKEPLNNGQSFFSDKIKELKVTVSDNPEQVELLGVIENEIEEWRKNAMDPAILLREEIGDAKTMNDVSDLIGKAEGKTFFDDFREKIKTFIDVELELLDKRIAAGEAAFTSAGKAIEDSKHNAKWVNHTNVVIKTAQSILTNAVDMETGLRGFLLSGKDEFLEPYDRGESQVNSIITGLQQTVSDNPPQVTLLGEIGESIANWQSDYAEKMIAMRREVGTTLSADDVNAAVAEARGKKYFDALRAQIDIFVEREQILLVKRNEADLASQKELNVSLETLQNTSQWIAHTYKVITRAKEIMLPQLIWKRGCVVTCWQVRRNSLSPMTVAQSDLITSFSTCKARNR